MNLKMKDNMYNDYYYKMNKIKKSKRAFPRFRVNFDFKYFYNSTPARCTILDISEGGMLIKVPQILEIGDKIELVFEDSKLNSVNIMAIVVHKNNNYVGVNFLFEEYDDPSFIRHFIHEIKNKNKL
jgi:c-di-GMP-binding flagellar brake protein YcgR